jgi:aryl-alcohol dehydrogenase-like predicted oxidoreductase
MTSRRQCLQSLLASGALLALDPLRALAAEAHKTGLITRAIPGSGERLPIIGLGSSATFARAARSDADALHDVLAKLVELGGKVFDTAPQYGAAEEVAGRIAQKLGIANQLFWATKLNVASRGGSADPVQARRQLDTSLERIGKPVIDLVQVHNMGDVRTQLPILREYKEKGRVRYVGVTTTFEGQYDELVRTMRSEPLDFIGTDYAIDNRDAERTILPLAQERGIAVLVYAPFGRTRLWRRVAERKLPEWAAEFDARSWAQFFLKYVASHPAVTAITPATSRPENMADNMGAAIGRLPDEAMRARMTALIDALPAA